MSFLDTLLGRPLATTEEEGQKINIISGIPALGLDGLSSAAYGPEAALTVLLTLGVAGVAYITPITGIILTILVILYFSYRQTIAAYPTGGGSYTVAKENLGVKFGLLAAAALMLDYTLNVAVGVSAGVEALISAVPSLHAHTLSICLIILALLTVANLRGVREAGLLFAVPTYLFVGTLFAVIGIGLYHMAIGHGHPTSIIPPPAIPKATEVASLWLLMKAFASGCTAMTGVEAVSNGVSAFEKPTVPNAQRTLTAIVAILFVLLLGIAYLAHGYNIAAMDESRPDYQSVLSQLIMATCGKGIFYYVTIAGILAVLALSANTSYAGFPRLCRLIAEDSFLPHSFQLLGRRLVYVVGIAFLTILSGVLLIVFGGITDRLIPLFAVGAFLAFTLSQAGMVVHWHRAAKDGANAAATHAKSMVNGIGAIATATALAVILMAKFGEGAWVSILIIVALLLIFAGIKRHYVRVARSLEFPHRWRVSEVHSPIVVVPIEGWNLITERALRFAICIGQDVTAVNIDVVDTIPEDTPKDQLPMSAKAQDLQKQWETYVNQPAMECGIDPPRLVILESPFRRVGRPLLEYVDRVKRDHPDRVVAIVIPEMVEMRWWEAILHSHRAAALKALLLLRGDDRVVAINVPWYLPEDAMPKE